MNNKLIQCNTIQLGDCYELIKQIPDKSIDCVYIDIPYLHNRGGYGHSELGGRTKKKRLELKEIEKGIDFSIFDDLCRIMKKINIFVWCSKLQILDIMKYFIDGKNCLFELMVWCKTNPTPTTNNIWLPDLEYCLYFREKRVPLNDGYELKSKWYQSSANKSDKDLYNHPTIKPLELVERHLKHATQPNDIVLDCFCGSGTTCVACKNIGRRYIGMEVNPAYYKTAIDRINEISQIEKKQRDEGQISLFDLGE